MVLGCWSRVSPVRGPRVGGGVGAGSGVDGRAAGFKPGDGDPERRAGHVVQADLVEEMDGFGVAAVFPADAELEVRSAAPTLGCPDLHQSTDAVGVDGLKG